MYKLVSRSLSLREGKGVGRREAAKAHVPDEPETVSDKTLRTPSYNDSATPADASKNARRLQHTSRPLPAIPPSKTKMADQPRTSDSDTMKTSKDGLKLNKRASRNDFYHGSRAYGGTRPGPLTSSRGNLPTPDTSPRTAAPAQRFASRGGAWEPAADPIVKVRNWDIGMALGSPSHPPIFSYTWNPRGADLNDSHGIASPPTSRSSSVDTFDMPVSKKATGKWKLFNIFTRKPSDQSAHAVSISDPNGLHGTSRPEEEIRVASQGPPLGSKSPARTSMMSSPKARRHRPIAARSQTVPTSAIVDGHDQNTRGSETQEDGGFRRIPITLDTDPKDGAMSGPLLNVEIPDVRLERYSVMFNSVLNANPSSLSKRQASLQKVRGIEDAVEREEGEEKVKAAARRVTSPQPARSSGLALFPTSIQSPKPMLHKLSPRLRSNTSPALLPSSPPVAFYSIAPSHRRQSREESPGSKRPGQPSPRHHAKPGIVITTPDFMEKETHQLPRAFRNGKPNLVFSSSAETEPIGHKAITRPFRKPQTRHLSPEPRWRVIGHSQKTPLTAVSLNARSRRKRSPSPSQSSSSRTQAAQLPDSAPSSTVSSPASSYYYPEGTSTGESSAKTRPIEISIARQISISRQQHKLLQPLRTGVVSAAATATPMSASKSTSPARRPSHASPAGTPGEKGRIAKTKTATPTLVHPPATLDPRLAQLPQYRRSERVVLEDA